MCLAGFGPRNHWIVGWSCHPLSQVLVTGMISHKMKGHSLLEGHPQACRVTEGFLCHIPQTYIRSMDKDFVAATIQAIGRCATNIGRVRDTCLNGLVQLLSNRDGQCFPERLTVMIRGCLPAGLTLLATGYPPVCLDTMCIHWSVCLDQGPSVPTPLRAARELKGVERKSQGPGALQVCLST